MSILDYFFFKFNQLILFNKTDDDTVINTYVGLAFFAVCNIFSVLFFIGIKLTVNISLIIFFITLIVSYRCFIYRGRWRQIKQRFENNDLYPKYGKMEVDRKSVVRERG